jgi:hypothetical protein
MEWLKRWRRKEQPTCAMCNRPQTLTTIRLVSGAHDQIEVIFRGLPVLSCETEGHPRRFALPDFGVYVINAVFWQDNVPLGRPGRLRAKVKCYKCRKNLDKEPVRASEVAGWLSIDELPQFGIRIRGPVTTCPRCESEQLWAPEEVGRDVSSAIVEAFRQAGLTP